MVTVEQVQVNLKNLPEAFVAADVVEEQIDTAAYIVNQEKSSEATAEQIERAVLAWAMYKTALAYAAEQERSLGVLSPMLTAWLDRLKEEAELELGYCKRMSSSVGKGNFADISDGLWEYQRLYYNI